MKSFYRGKLLLTAEYFVLHGAQALALPTVLGQHFEFIPDTASQQLQWKSNAPKQNNWFQATFQLDPLKLSSCSDTLKGHRLLDLLTTIVRLKPGFLKTQGGTIASSLDFEPLWGLGTSSTLVAFLAEWTKIDPYTLLELSFRGSGYDVACATANQPLLYRKTQREPVVTPCVFNPPFKQNLYFVYRNKKQNSHEAIQKLSYKIPTTAQLHQMDALTQEILKAKDLEGFQQLLQQHENIISEYLEETPVQEQLFKDFKGVVKSLGAWGGDFMLALGDKSTPAYFKAKGFSTIFSYIDLIV